ncbi:hypothetical protein HPP92_014113 [Vanilla planifolia]|uniref:Uncharacterized protein n=1 Tax=Vanilla planifolia TaxID=51239 RepID=A0A835UUG1_VANPL|nr:hypothetical protein HPP92_014113 [Vanilla planifolia]
MACTTLLACLRRGPQALACGLISQLPPIASSALSKIRASTIVGTDNRVEHRMRSSAATNHGTSTLEVESSVSASGFLRLPILDDASS